jgi:DNA repair protein RadA/Sms
MARDGAVYVCQSCGAVAPKWSGQCAGCGAWNSLVEEVVARPPGALAPTSRARKAAISSSKAWRANRPPRSGS